MSSPCCGLVCAGNWLIDHVKLIDAWPEQDALANIGQQTQANGGGPYNVAKDLARLGAPFPLHGLGLVGHDGDGDTIVADCARHGIGTAQLRRTREAPTSYTDVMTVASTGRRTFFHQRGTNALFGEEHFADLAQTGASALYLAYLLLLDKLDVLAPDGTTGAARVLARARAVGLTTIVDCVSANVGDFARIVRPSLPHTDVLFANEYEAGRILGRSLVAHHGVDAVAASAAAAELLALGVRQCVVLHFPTGAIVRTAAGAEFRQGSVRLPAGQIAGAAGAGDAFAAGFLLGYLAGEALPQCLRLAVCAAAASLRHPSCSEAVGPAREALALGESFGFLPEPS